MSRRRPSIRAYVRRRWRTLGLILVLLAGSLLVLVVTDRGHDPVWDARAAAGPGGTVDQVVASPDARLAYALVRTNGNISALQARDGVTGELLWDSHINATRALLAASASEVAVATDFPRAFLTIFANNGTPLAQVALEGNPRALVVEDDRVALALLAPGNPVLVFDDAALTRTLHFAAFVNSLDLERGRLAVGTGTGGIVVQDRDGAEILNASLSTSVKTLRLDGDGSSLLVGGAALTPGDLSGTLAFFDVGEPAPLRWSHATPVAVSLVDLDDAGILALAIEDTLPRHTLAMLDGGTGTTRWTRPLDGIVPSDDAGERGGAALSSDARHVVVATLRGPVESFEATTGRPEWSFASQGSSVVTFARDSADRFVADGSLAPNGPYDSIFLFSETVEPFRGRMIEVAALLFAIAVLTAAATVGIGYWRVRRSY